MLKTSFQRKKKKTLQFSSSISQPIDVKQIEETVLAGRNDVDIFNDVAEWAGCRGRRR
jgi:hypothetical protein